MGRGRLSYDPSQSATWRDKVDPLLLEIARFHAQIARLERSGLPEDRAMARSLRYRELYEEALRIWQELKGEGHPHYLAMVKNLGFGDKPSDSDILSCEEMVRAYFPLFMYRKTIAELEKEKDAYKLGQIEKRIWGWKLGLRELNDWPTKTNRDHYFLMARGLDLGLAELKESELADCFDSLCACGKVHSGESLRKLRDDIISSASERT